MRNFIMRLEKAREFVGRDVRVDLVKRRGRLMRAGGLVCDKCRWRPATILSGNSGQRAVCDACHADRALKRRIELQRATVKRWRSR